MFEIHFQKTQMSIIIKAHGQRALNEWWVEEVEFFVMHQGFLLHNYYLFCDDGLFSRDQLTYCCKCYRFLFAFQSSENPENSYGLGSKLRMKFNLVWTN